MSRPRLVVGCPVWDRSWSLPIYFDALEANVDKATTGLVFVVPPSDSRTRDVISDRAAGYQFVEILRDPYEARGRDVRRDDNFATLAAARNMLLQHVNQVRPDWFLSWDSDFIVGPGVVEKLLHESYLMCGLWAWLNRQPPHKGQHWDGEKLVPVQWDDPVSCTGMNWVESHGHQQMAEHIDPRTWKHYAREVYTIDVVLAFQLMHPLVYSTTRYAPHPHGEDIPFNWSLEQRGVSRWMWALDHGVHLYDQATAELEVAKGYESVMQHVSDIPLAAKLEVPDNELLSTIGFYPL